MDNPTLYQKRACYAECGAWTLSLSVYGATPEEQRANRHRLLQDLKQTLREVERGAAMSQCDCCGEECQLLEVIGNADQEPWQVCARCLHQDLDQDDDDQQGAA